jgi:hypothetical protein
MTYAAIQTTVPSSTSQSMLPSSYLECANCTGMLRAWPGAGSSSVRMTLSMRPDPAPGQSKLQALHLCDDTGLLA